MISVVLLLAPIVYYFSFQVRTRQDIIELPALVSVIFVTWLAPQLAAVQAQEAEFAFWSVALYGLFGGLCFMALKGGFSLGTRALRRVASASFAPTRLTTLAVLAASTISLMLNLEYLSALEANREISQWTGSGTIIAFFSSIRYIAFAASALAFFRYPSTILGLPLAANFYVVFTIAFVELRRSDIVALIIAMILIYYFVRNRLPSPIVLTILALIAGLFVFGISELRTLQRTSMGAGEWGLGILFNGNLSEIVTSKSISSSIGFAPDVRNGVYILKYCLETFDFRLGAETWNDMVWQYVPAQIVGADVKMSLVIGERVSIYSNLADQFGYYRSPGTTRTGIGSAFLDLGIIGVGYFWLIGYCCGRVFRQAAQGDTISQVFYIALIPTVLISITHSHTHFFTQFPLLYAGAVCLRYANWVRLGKATKPSLGRPHYPDAR